MEDDLYDAMNRLSSGLGVPGIAPLVIERIVAEGWGVDPEHFTSYLTLAGHKALAAERRARGHFIGKYG